jgi:hypothetical protein
MRTRPEDRIEQLLMSLNRETFVKHGRAQIQFVIDELAAARPLQDWAPLRHREATEAS